MLSNPRVPHCAPMQTKEAFIVQLREWEMLDEGCTVYHIISPLFGGIDHPHNFRVLPSNHPADYHLSEGLALWHHIAMLRLLGVPPVRKALEASLGIPAAAAKLAELTEREEQFKGAIRPPLPVRRRNGDAAAGPDAGEAAAEPDAGEAAAAPSAAVPGTPAGPSGAGSAAAAPGTAGVEQEASEAEPSDGPGPSKRARTEGEEPASAAQEGVVEEIEAM